MKLYMSPELTRPITTTALARKSGLSKRTLWRWLIVLHGRDRARGPEHTGWLLRQSSGPWCVNLAKLRAEHPEVFVRPAAHTPSVAA